MTTLQFTAARRADSKDALRVTIEDSKLWVLVDKEENDKIIAQEICLGTVESKDEVPAILKQNIEHIKNLQRGVWFYFDEEFISQDQLDQAKKEKLKTLSGDIELKKRFKLSFEHSSGKEIIWDVKNHDSVIKLLNKFEETFKSKPFNIEVESYYVSEKYKKEEFDYESVLDKR